MEEEQYYTIILRHDTSTNWDINNPILAFGEYGVEDDTHRIKRGDGQRPWTDLAYEDFGLSYLLTFTNIGGEVVDNIKLNEAIEAKIPKQYFDTLKGNIVSEITIQKGNLSTELLKITKSTVNVNTGMIIPRVLNINSSDETILADIITEKDGSLTLDLRMNMVPLNTVYTELGFLESIKSGARIILGTDIKISSTITLPENADIEIIGNGYKLDISEVNDRVFVSPNDYNGTLKLKNMNMEGFTKTLVTMNGKYATLEIEGGTYNGNNESTHIILATGSANVKATGVKFINAGQLDGNVSAAIIASGGNIEVTNCTFENCKSALFSLNSGCVINNNCTFINNLSDIYNQDTNTNVTFTLTSFIESSKNGGIITLGDNIKLSNSIILPANKDLTINGNEYYIDANFIEDNAFKTEENYNATLTLNNINIINFKNSIINLNGGTLKIVGGVYNAQNKPTNIIESVNASNVFIDGSTFENVATEDDTIYAAIKASGGTLNIVGSKISDNRCGIYIYDECQLEQTNNTFQNNIADIYNGDTNTIINVEVDVEIKHNCIW